MPRFSKKSLGKLETCHIDLQRLFKEAIKYRDFSVIDGHRGKELQNAAYFTGMSKVKYPNSNHNKNPSDAVDIFPAPYDWGDIYAFHDFADFIKELAHDMRIEVRWGGDFKGFFDGPHWERVIE